MPGARVGEPQVITCTVNRVSGIPSSLVMITWIGPGGVNITNGTRMTISPTTSSGNTDISRLWFTYLMEGDEGNYTCNVTILRTNASGLASLELRNFIG